MTARLNHCSSMGHPRGADGLRRVRRLAAQPRLGVIDPPRVRTGTSRASGRVSSCQEHGLLSSHPGRVLEEVARALRGRSDAGDPA